MMATLLSLIGIEEGMENEGHQLINSSALMVHIFLSLLAIDRYDRYYSGRKHAFAMGFTHMMCTYIQCLEGGGKFQFVEGVHQRG